MTIFNPRVSIAAMALGVAMAGLALPAAAAAPPATPATPPAPPIAAGQHAGHAPPAANAVAMPAWDALTDAQRAVLIAPIRERWNGNADARGRMYGHAQRWQSMTPAQRKEAQRGMRRWDHMSPGQRDKARGMFDKLRDLPPEQQAAARARFKAMTPEERRAWLDKEMPAAATTGKPAPATSADKPAR